MNLTTHTCSALLIQTIAPSDSTRIARHMHSVIPVARNAMPPHKPFDSRNFSSPPYSHVRCNWQKPYVILYIMEAEFSIQNQSTFIRCVRMRLHQSVSTQCFNLRPCYIGSTNYMHAGYSNFYGVILQTRTTCSCSLNDGDEDEDSDEKQMSDGLTRSIFL